MFTKGPRFNPLKPSEVPPPGAYNVQTSLGLESYKKGAFLEKADRFNTKEPQPSSERYVQLQQKVDDLERVHLEDKKTHQAQLEKLRQELVASQKLAIETADKLERQKRAKSTLEGTVQELRKSSLADQGEIKDLKHKLRVLEIERDKSASKQPEINELRKNIHALEMRRKDESRESDKRLAELEGLLQEEKRKRELSASKAKDLQTQMQKLRTALEEKDAQLQSVDEEARVVRERAAQLESTTANQEQDLLDQLENHRSLLKSVTAQYSSLASQTTSLAQHQQLKQSLISAQLQHCRLERKLANSDGQVLELTHLIRQLKDQNTLLVHQLQDALQEISFLRNIQADAKSPTLPHDGTDLTLSVLHGKSQIEHERTIFLQSILRTSDLLSTFYTLEASQVHFASTIISKECTDTLARAEQLDGDLKSALASHEAIAARLESVQKAHLADQEALGKAMTQTEILQKSNSLLESQLSEASQRLDRVDSVHASAIKKEKDTIQRLSTTIQKNRMAEDALRAEVDRLGTEITELEGYADAYNKLYDQVGSLLARKQIAQEEAERISRFNAEILGHNNPAQRIMYVDRIRTELAETKMQLAEREHENDTLQAIKSTLEHELQMYKSVGVENKPRTHITRVGRQPFVNLTQSVNNVTLSESEKTQSLYSNDGQESGKLMKKLPFKITLSSQDVQESSPEDMTLDEIL